MRSLPGRPATTKQATGTKETMYALVSVLSHTLQVPRRLGMTSRMPQWLAIRS